MQPDLFPMPKINTAPPTDVLLTRPEVLRHRAMEFAVVYATARGVYSTEEIVESAKRIYKFLAEEPARAAS